MHDTAFKIGAKFLEIYARAPQCMVVEIGSMDINGSLRKACAKEVIYLGLDQEYGKGVDIIVPPGQPLPLKTEFADVVISSSQMEHDPEFWVTLVEMFRILKPGGYLYINTPSNGAYHTHPLDAWRFYPDAGKAFASWGRKNKYPMTLLESFTAKRVNDKWNDFVCVLFKGEWTGDRTVNYISDAFECYNVWRWGATEISRRESFTEDQQLIDSLRKEVVNLKSQVASLSGRLAEKEGAGKADSLVEQAKTPVQSAAHSPG